MAFKQAHHTLELATPGRGLTLFTAQVEGWLAAERPGDGLLTLFIQHTSASLLIQENADPSARRDLEAWLNRLVPEHDPLYTHTSEGPDDMPSHVKAMLTATSLAIPILDGGLALGTWQGIYLWEHHRQPGARHVVVHVAAEAAEKD
ncbi:MAG TPA: secondary thiamine-phosphate synthase enzyme YjbQ [Thermoanaerobaculia bacterium]|nr:secondary thiamine-phosphate synthase enzyme YjbQ [Thermoanaerobaculia bacterium]